MFSSKQNTAPPTLLEDIPSFEERLREVEGKIDAALLHLQQLLAGIFIGGSGSGSGIGGGGGSLSAPNSAAPPLLEDWLAYLDKKAWAAPMDQAAKVNLAALATLEQDMPAMTQASKSINHSFKLLQDTFQVLKFTNN